MLEEDDPKKRQLRIRELEDKLSQELPDETRDAVEAGRLAGIREAENVFNDRLSKIHSAFDGFLAVAADVEKTVTSLTDQAAEIKASLQDVAAKLIEGATFVPTRAESSPQRRAVQRGRSPKSNGATSVRLLRPVIAWMR